MYKKNTASVSLLLLFLLTLSGCKTLDTIGSSSTPSATAGPSVGPAVGPEIYPENTEKPYVYDSSIFLDVAVPIFDPGLPKNDQGIDYQKIEKDGIWPQLRRAEANRFAVETKRAIEKIGSFGAVRVVPNASASSDIYVLGNINESDSEFVSIDVQVLDSRGKQWGKRQFEHRVSEGFYRDRENDGKDPYGPIFAQIADYVYQLLTQQAEADKEKIKAVTELRYAQLYAPEVFSQHLSLKKTWDGQYQYELVSLPNPNSAMANRIKPLRIQDQLFIDRLQTQYDTFYAKSNESYRAWQKETLPEAIAFRETKKKRNLQAGAGAALAALAILVSRNSDSSAASAASTIGLLASTYFIGSSLNKNSQLKVHKQAIDELGESLDIELNSQLMTHNDQTIELTGTANEQYQQWKNHLKAIYELEKTPNQPL